MMMLCRQLMTEDVVCCVQSDSAHDAALRMMDFGIGAVPIVDSADRMRLVGIITDRDLVLRVMAAGKQARETVLYEIMSSDVATCHPNDTIQKALEMMGRYQVRRITIVDEEMHVIGMISQADIANRLQKDQVTGEVVEKISKQEPEADVSRDTDSTYSETFASRSTQGISNPQHPEVKHTLR